MSIVLILANGKSTRFGRNKLQEDIGNISVLEKTLNVFENHPEVEKIFLVGENFSSEEKTSKKLLKSLSKLQKIFPGGKTRYASFCTGIREISQSIPSLDNKKILVHNAANPFVTAEEVCEVLTKISPNTCVGVGRKITNTLRQWDEKNPQKKYKTINREKIYAMETPQGGFLEDFLHWISVEKKISEEEKIEITDELMLAEKNAGQIIILPASNKNIKITTPKDIPAKIPITGFGIDSHRFEEKKSSQPCILCGVEIKNSPKFLGNSDGDIAFHALCNALLSSIGQNSFSSISDPLCKAGEKNSEIYLKKVLKIFEAEGKIILHLVLSFEGKYPKIEKYFPKFRHNLSQILSLSSENIGLNATTGENIDGYGKGEGMKVSALVTVI